MHLFQNRHKGTKSFSNKQIYFNIFSFFRIYSPFSTPTLQYLYVSPAISIFNPTKNKNPPKRTSESSHSREKGDP